MWRRAVTLVNARVAAEAGIASSIRFASRVLSLGDSPGRSDVVVDVDGAFVLPGLVNAHDHLELNHYGRLKFRDSYENASQWIDDMRPRLREDPVILDGRSKRLTDRLLAGGLKNLLSGTTTVSHHNPLYSELRRGFPVRVVRRYGWAHSFTLERAPVGAAGERGPDVAQAFARTPRDAPFLVHLGEGYDESARSELSRLADLECLRGNTVLVHGVGLSPEDWSLARRAGAGLVWCPASNRFLFGTTAPVDAFVQREPGSESAIAIGTDSRLSGARDLLEELREARAATTLEPAKLLRMVTANGASLLKVPRAGRIAPGLPADLLVIPPLAPDPAEALLRLDRSRIRLVAVAGRPVVGAPEMRAAFEARRVPAAKATLDGEARVLDAMLVRRIQSSKVAEPGLKV
ncbi:MAG TPA: amidohydrolase family protein [Vicinamibacteria bacterium]|nr:amidohydrolase family protein [Vicinamibacteria bacterium]